MNQIYDEWYLCGTRTWRQRGRDTIENAGKKIGFAAKSEVVTKIGIAIGIAIGIVTGGVTVTPLGASKGFAQEIPATDGNQNPGDRLPGGGVDWSYLADELNPDRVQVQLGDAGGVIFTQPGIRNRGPSPIIPRVPWATGNTGPTTALAGRPFKTPMGVRVIGGYTILPTSPGVARVNAGFAGIPAPTDSRPEPDLYPDRFEQMKAQQLRLRAIRQAAGPSGIDHSGTAGQPSANAIHSNESFHNHPIYAETSLRNRPPVAVYSPQVRSYSNQSSTKIAAIPSVGSDVPNRGTLNGPLSTDQEILWMRDRRLPVTSEVPTEDFNDSFDSNSMTASNGGYDENTWNIDNTNNINDTAGAGNAWNTQGIAGDGNSLAQMDPAVSIAQRITGTSGIQRLTPMHVYVSGSTVTLQGVVQNATDRDLAGAIAQQQPGIRRVRNELRVSR